MKVEIELLIISACLPSPRDAALTVSYWSWNAGRLMEPRENDEIWKQYGCRRYTASWWRVMENFAASWKQYRMNEVLIYPQALLRDGGTELDGSGSYRFAWNRFDQVVRFFYEKSNAKCISGSRLIFTPKTVTGDEDYQAYIPIMGEHGSACQELWPVNSVAAEQWWGEYLPALQNHLERMGLLEAFRQQIGDEPHTPQQIAQWRLVRERMRRYAPKIKIGDAFNCQSGLDTLGRDVDIWVPQLDVYEENRFFYEARQQEGAQVWTYVCNLPAENSLNRNVDQPAWMGRVLLWLAARYGLTGFLHWAWNMWQIPKDALNCRGQGYIVLPDRENLTVFSTIRQENLLEGIQDYELLRLLKAQHPAAHEKLVQQVVRNRGDYESQPHVLQRTFDGLYEAFKSGDFA